MGRISLRDFSKYLVLSPPADMIPSNALRRARGIHPVKTLTIRSRAGNDLVSNTRANSLCIFMDLLFQHYSGVLYRNGVSIKSIAGTYLYFLPAPPTPGKPDYLFVSNGSSLWKVDSSGTVTKWGIVAPIDGFTATANAAQSVAIDLMEDPGAVARWTASSVTVTADTTNFIQGTQSLNLAIAAGTKGMITQSVSKDLSKFSSNDLTSGADYIALQMWVDEPNRLDSVQIQFSLNNTTFSNNFFTRVMDMNIPDSTAKSDTDTSFFTMNTVDGLGDLDEFATTGDEEDFIGYLNGTKIVDGANENVTYETTKIPLYKVHRIIDELQKDNIKITGEFKPLLIPLSTFTRSGEGNYSWADVKAVRITFRTNSKGAVNVKIDDFKLLGGCGTQGTYKYYITFENSVTGSISNPNPTPVIVKNVIRQTIALANLPVSSDAQVDKIGIWRTVGNGAVPFKAGTVDNGTTTFTDNIGDTYVLDPRSSAKYLASEALQITNIVPFSTFGPCCYYNGAIFWINKDTNNSGNLYYSRTGYVESVQGFIRVTNSSDALQTVVLWNGLPYVFSKGRVFQITGTNPYYAKEVLGVPGTDKPKTVIPTLYGIFYKSQDGIRLFNGVQSKRVGWVSMGRLLSGENVENLTAFNGGVATFAREEYIISDGSQTLAYNAAEDTWRDLGVGFTSLYTDRDTGIPYGSNADGVFELDQVGRVVDEVTEVIPFEVETFHKTLDVDKVVMVNHLHLDINTEGNNIQVDVLGNGEIVHTIFTTTSTRQVVTIPIGREYNRIGVRLSCNITAKVEIFGIDWDVDMEQDLLANKYYEKLLLA